jgi:hypothetical protein
VIRLSEIIGQKFGLLTAVEVVGKNRRGPLIKCQCDCGGLKTVNAKDLRNGNNKSCGCLHKKHGLTRTRPYLSWQNMKKRCDYPSHKSYKNYGGRGITYCDKWETFDGFWEDMKDGYADHLTLDRIDVDGNYTKENCRWADKGTQANNTTTNSMITFDGETLTEADFARKYNLDYELFRHRLQKGWTIERAMEPAKQKELLTYEGTTKTVTEWAEEKGMTYHQLKKRLMRGWSTEKALNQPLRKAPKK